MLTQVCLIKTSNLQNQEDVNSSGHNFGSIFRSKIYSDSSLDEALKLQKSMNADMGGTEILDPLKKVYSQKCNPNYPRQVQC